MKDKSGKFLAISKQKLVDIRKLQREIAEQIMKTPTSEVRNTLTACSIMFSYLFGNNGDV